MKQRDLFDSERGEELRDDAIESVDSHADDEWKEAALQVVRRCASNYETFTTDDVWRRLGKVSTHEHRAMGAVMQRAKSLGWISPTEEWRLSHRAACHRRPLRVWRSDLIVSLE